MSGSLNALRKSNHVNAYTRSSQRMRLNHERMRYLDLCMRSRSNASVQTFLACV